MPLNFPPDPEPNEIYTAFGKSWRWNGEAWETYSPAVTVANIFGTPNEVEVAGINGNYTVGLPPDVTVSNSVRSQYFNIGGATFSGGAGGISLSSSLEVNGDINISGTLVVDGPIVSKSGFSGFTLDGDIEPITDVSLDGGEF